MSACYAHADLAPLQHGTQQLCQGAAVARVGYVGPVLGSFISGAFVEMFPGIQAVCDVLQQSSETIKKWGGCLPDEPRVVLV